MKILNIENHKVKCREVFDRPDVGSLASEIFEHGFFRFAKVILVNKNSDDFLEPKFKNQIYGQFDKIRKGDEKRAYLKNVLKSEVDQYQPIEYMVGSDSSVYSYGKTNNNLRELKYLELEIKKVDHEISFTNLADVDRSRSKAEILFLKSDLMRSLDSIFLKEFQVSKGLIYQSILYLRAFINFYVTFWSRGRTTRGVFCVANDHSPVQVAFVMIGRLFGFKTIYIQHAEITTAFPNLVFDFNILKNRKSKHLYREIGPICGLTQVARPERRQVDPEELIMKMSSCLTANRKIVVIYGSSIVSQDAVVKLCLGLLSKDDVADVYFKPHPRCANDDLEFLTEIGVVPLFESPSFGHIAICGNSSVCIEIAARGCPVFLSFDIDSLPRDYYGFAISGLFPEVPLEGLRDSELGEFKFNADFVEKLSMYDPTIKTVTNVKEVSSWSYFVKNLVSEISGDLDRVVNNKKMLLLRDSLVFWPRTFFSYVRDRGIPRYYDGFLIVKLLDGLFNDRDPDFMRTIQGLDCTDCSNIIEFWVQLKRVEFSGYNISELELLNIERYLSKNEFTSQIGRWHEARYLGLLLRIADVARLGQLLKGFRYVTVTGLPISLKVALYRFFLRRGLDLPAPIKDEIFANESDFHRLKIEVQSEAVDDLEHIKIARKFIKFSPPNLSKDFCDLFSFYNSLTADRDFIDIKWSQELRSKFEKLIKSHLQACSPFSMIRLSDGEGYIFSETKGAFTEADAKNRERHWWGEEIDRALSKRIKQELLRSVREADMVGIPTVYRFLRDHNDRSRSLAQTLQGRGLLEVINWARSHLCSSQYCTDDKINLALFLDPKFIVRLASCANKLIFVTSASKESISSVFGSSLNFECVALPTHFKTSANSRYLGSTRPLPYIYEDVKKELESLVCPGDLVLVAGGIVGKLFISHSKRLGAVALDMGSAMDDIIGAGVHSLH